MNREVLEKLFAVEDMIASFESRIFQATNWMQNHGQMFPELNRKASEDIDTQRACVERLKKYYNNLTDKIKKL